VFRVKQNLLFNLLAAISLLLCLGTIVLWFRGMSHWDEAIYFNTPNQGGSGTGNEVHVHTFGGSFAVEFDLLRDSPSQPLVKRWFITRTADLSQTGFRDYLTYRLGPPTVTGFGWSAKQQSPPLPFGQREQCAVRIPKWFVILVSAGLPALWLRRRLIRRRRQRAQQQLCINCGYDLRATPDRCPECGMEARA
jgi:hypothetical protein